MIKFGNVPSTIQSIIEIFLVFTKFLPVHAHDPSWGAISALGAVKLGQSSLDDVVTNCSIADSFHCGDFPPVARKDGDETLEDRIKLLREKKSQVIKRRNTSHRHCLVIPQTILVQSLHRSSP